jgi:hypothetical protein
LNIESEVQLKLLSKILWVLSGAVAALVVVKVVEDHANEANVWQDAWDKSSIPAEDVA